MDNDDATFFTVFYGLELAHFAVVHDVSRVRAIGVNAAQDIHQRGLARAVLTYKGVDFSFLHLKVHVVKRLYAGERLGYVPHFQQIFCHWNLLLPSLRKRGCLKWSCI